MTTYPRGKPNPRSSLYASLGLGEFAVQKLRELPAELHKLPDRVAELRGEAAALQDKANELYADFALRGERLVGAVRGQPSTQAAADEATSATRAARDAASSAGKTAKASKQAAQDAGDTLG